MSRGIAPLANITVARHFIAAHGLIPNTSIHNKPLLIYRSVFPEKTTAAQIEDHLRAIDVVQPRWRYTMYQESHFHSTSHEVLAIASGRAELCFGHEDNPSRVVETLDRGDVVVIPAGVAHRLIRDLHGDFEMVGCYPKGCSWDMCYGRENEKEKIQKMVTLAWFEADPLYGHEGPAQSA